MKKLILTISIIILSSCSAQYHLRKALAKDPTIIKNDTIVRIDTVFKKIMNVDTVFKFNYSDTVIIINKDSVIVKYFHSHTDSLTYIQADCPDCPEVTNTKKITKTIKVEPTFIQKLKDVSWVFLILGVVIGMIILIVSKRINR